MVELSYFAILIIVIAVMTVVMIMHQFIWRQYQKHIAQLSAKNVVLKDEESKHKESEESIRLKEKFYHVLFSNTEDMVFVHGVTQDDLPSMFLEVNDIACKKLGYSRQELLSKNPVDIEVAVDVMTSIGYTASQMVTLSDEKLLKKEKRLRERPARNVIEQLNKNGHFRYGRMLQSADGTEFPVEVHAHKFDLPGRAVVMCTAHDISDRKKAELALSESERRFRSFFAHSPTGIAIYDEEKQLVDVNPACLRMFGVPDQSEFAMFNMFDNAFVPQHVKKKLKSGESVRYEAVVDYEKVRASSLFVSSMTGKAYYDIMIGNLGQTEDFQARGYLAQVQDISKRRAAEQSLSESEKQLRQAEKMEAIGSMAGGIAHDFNNILTPILGYTEITLRVSDKEDKVYSYLQEVLKACHRAKDLVNQILTFSRQRDKEAKPIRLTPIVKEVLTLIEASLPDGIDISRVIKTDQDIVMSDSTQMHQVLMNLCANATHAMRNTENGLLEVMTTEFVLEPRSKSRYPNLEPGRYIRISVKDNGTGIDSATLDRMFEPFFTTKRSGEGTGMGLAVVHSIIRSFRGTIKVETELGEGTVFHVILPTLEDQAEAFAAEAEKPLPSGTETILIVDDEPEIIEMEACMLGDLGYKPIIANESKRALQLFKATPERFNIAIIDQVMPGMIGSELASEMMKIRPDFPVILCTGFSESVSSEDAESQGIKRVLMKPIVMRELAEAVRSELDATT